MRRFIHCRNARATTALILACVSGSVEIPADNSWFGNFPKFTPPEVEVNWSTTTTNLVGYPCAYRVIRQTFPEAAISNLMSLGPFTANVRADSRISVSSKENTRHLFVNPENGWIHYWDEKAIVVKGPVVGVPTSKQSEDLALRLFDRFGFSRSELAKKSGETNYLAFEDERTLTRFDKELGKEVSVTSGRGTYFVRQVDGIPFAGIGNGGGFHAKFGNNAAISEIEIVWRKLERFEKLSKPTAEEITRSILNGGTVMTRGTAVDAAAGPLDSTQVSSITITTVVPLYTSAGGNERQDFVYPFLKVSSLANYKGTESFIVLYCPIASSSVQR